MFLKRDVFDTFWSHLCVMFETHMLLCFTNNIVNI